MLFKVSFGEDIRRFTIDHSVLSFSALETQLANLYHLPPRGFKIYYTDNEGDRVVLSSNEELHAAVSYALGQSNALRLTIELSSRKEEPFIQDKVKLEQLPVLDIPKLNTASSVTTSTGTNTEAPVAAKTQPIITSSSSASTNTLPIQQSTASTSVEISTNSVGMNTLPEDRVGKIIDELDMDELLAHPKFQEKFAVILSHAISTQAFSQLLQSMLPQMRDILKESIKVTSSRGNEVTNEVNNKIEVTPVSSSPSSSFSNPPIVPLVSNIVGSVELNSSVLENKPEISTTNISSSNDQVLFTKENRDPISEFAIITDDPKKVEKEQKPSTPLLDSFLSLFKSNNSSHSNNVNTNNTPSSTLISKPLPVVGKQDQVENEEVVIPNLEELLSQLEAMGFHNREQNIKTLRFHKKFNEGLDEVIEDLLSQEAKQQK